MTTLKNIKIKETNSILAPQTYNCVSTDFSIEEWRGICKLFELDPIVTSRITIHDASISIDKLELKGVLND